MTASDIRYGRRGGRSLPRGVVPGGWRAIFAAMRERAGDDWPNPDAEWSARNAEVDLEGLARMALARQAAGLELSDLDREALRRHPNPRSCFFPGQLHKPDREEESA